MLKDEIEHKNYTQTLRKPHFYRQFYYWEEGLIIWVVKKTKIFFVPSKCWKENIAESGKKV